MTTPAPENPATPAHPDPGLEAAALPRHVAVIMDGNGRWATERNLPRIRGHEAGVESVRAVTRECARLGLERLTLYAFSTENWKRPREEVDFLMAMLERFLIGERDEIMDNNVLLTAIGRLSELPPGVIREYERTREMSRRNTGLTLSLALNYSARAELVDAARALAKKALGGVLRPEDITEDVLAAHLSGAPAPDPDLIIRTAGEMRLSNFLLWQASYAELYVSPLCWPEFREDQLHEAFREYARRTRTFGALPADEQAGRPEKEIPGKDDPL